MLVINENDTTTTDEISFGDSDFLAAQVAILGADRLVLLTDTGGLYSSDPRRDPGARLVEVSAMEELEGYNIGLSARRSGRAGCARRSWRRRWPRPPASRWRSRAGVDRQAIAAVLAGEPSGTLFQPRQGRVSSFKLWLKYAKPTHGRLVIDEGAELALRERGTSLLPVGVVEVEGEFEAGDAVECAATGARWARG